MKKRRNRGVPRPRTRRKGNFAVESTGLQLEAVSKHHTKIEDPGPGKHLWIVTSVYRVKPTTGRVHLDMENLLTIEGPGCMKCEELYSREVASRPCPGDPVDRVAF